MVKKILRLVVQVLLIFFFIVGFVNLVKFSIEENNKIEIKKVEEHLQMLNDSKAARGIK